MKSEQLHVQATPRGLLVPMTVESSYFYNWLCFVRIEPYYHLLDFSLYVIPPRLIAVYRHFNENEKTITLSAPRFEFPLQTNRTENLLVRDKICTSVTFCQKEIPQGVHYLLVGMNRASNQQFLSLSIISQCIKLCNCLHAAPLSSLHMHLRENCANSDMLTGVDHVICWTY